MSLITNLWWVWLVLLLLPTGLYVARYVNTLLACCVSAELNWREARPRFGRWSVCIVAAASILLFLSAFLA